MAQDDPPPGGLLSKVVKFVRNPTVNWADLDQPEDKDSHYSKQMLKEMIERKRANDFVRRREFDQLRKLRLRGSLAGPLGDGAADRPSFFNTSQTSRDDDRAGTIKKIDAIEAQMAQQWWKGRDAPPPPQVAAGPATPAPAPMRPDEAEDDYPAHHFATTIDASLLYASDDAFPPSSRADAVLLDDLPALGRAVAAPAGDLLEPDWPATPGFVETAPAYAHDPHLEEAAIRFANGDDAGAEAVLAALVDPLAQAPATEEAWLTLLDLYRAVGPRERFDAVAARFAAAFGRPSPAWTSLAGEAAAVLPSTDASQPRHWSSPAAQGAPSVPEELAARGLAFARGRQAVEGPLSASGVQASLFMQPSQAGQDLPGLPAARDTPLTQGVPADPGVQDVPAGPRAPAALAGVLTGEATDVLARLDAHVGDDNAVFVACDRLVRIDFAATGSVLTWAAAQHAAGRRVQFFDLHRLVAIFFNVVGVGEYAAIRARRD